MVKLITKTLELVQERQMDSEVGFVPTMGNLHAGHLSLLRDALSQYKTVYFSIFVNPKQFGPHEDFNRYPRTLEKDLELIQETVKNFPDSKVIVFHPENPQEIFPPSFNLNISVWNLSGILEGEKRPGHFDGVTTVVYQLFHLVKPNTSYFGLKDYQQYLIIKKMVKDLHLPIHIKGMPIIREESGLALSSRNQYLSNEEKISSLKLNLTLKKIAEILDSKKSNIIKAKDFIQQTLQDKNWNYLELRDSENLSQNIDHSKNISILAVYQLGSTRLLDNMQVEIK
jgi:pantoate--beta-alanine ligase